MGAASEPQSADFARILSLIGAVLFAFAAYQLIATQAVLSDSVFNPLLHGVGWISAGLSATSLHLTFRPYPRIPDGSFPCPECKEYVRKRAMRCPHCGTDLFDDQEEKAAAA